MTTTSKRLRIAPARGFTLLSLELFLRGKAPSIDVYAFVEDETRPQRLADRTQRIDDEQVQHWMESGLRGLLVRDQDLAQLADQMEGSLDKLLTDENLTIEERFRLMQAVACSSIDMRLKRAEAGDWVRESSQLASRLLGLMTEGKVSARSLFEVAAHDTTTFVHTTNVSAYLLLLATERGVRDEIELQQIVQGGLLHDFGRQFLPAEIVKKTGPLKPEELRQFEKHPTLGYEALLNQPGVTRDQLMMVYQHNEWANGGGFPVAIVGDETHPWAKMLAVVDAFDDLTAGRPHREGMSAQEALVQISAKAGEQFDPEVAQCWMSVFEQASPTKSGRASASPRPKAMA